MPIKNIIIQNIKGISQLKIESEILKNRPNILVAPNGFGKTSIATAFKCAVDQTSIKLDDEDRYQQDSSKQATIELEVEENGEHLKLGVTEKAYSNDIRKYFDIHVISDLRKIKTSSQWLPGGHIKPKAKMIIDPIIICNKINKTNSPYKISKIKSCFGNHREALLNIETSFFQSPDFIMRCPECWQFVESLLKQRKWNQFENIRKQISDYNGSTDDALSHVASDIDDIFSNLAEARELLSIIEATTNLNRVDAFLSIWQILHLYKTDGYTLKNYVEWLRYIEIKESLQEGLNDLNTSWKIPILKETKGSLIAEMPDPACTSNGQRDVLLMLTLLHIARYNLTKSRAILLIDEVFDYLDDANITVAQYYISQLISDYKRQGRSIYIMILTHLNPSFFRNFVFSDQNTIFLANGSCFDSIDAMKKLINARSSNECNKDLQDSISKFLVHFHIDDYDFSEKLMDISGIRSSWGKTGRFQNFLQKEFDKYNKGQPYDPLAICALTRRSIEELAFHQISTHPDSKDFFDIYKTGPKLDYALHLGANIPETHYLLKIIFDDGLHWNFNRDNTIPIVAKLSNPILHKLITEVVVRCREIS